MISNFFKSAWRNLGKNRAFSFINIFGLAVGLCCFMLIAAFVKHETSYDRYAKESGNIYRVHLAVTGNGDVAEYPNVDNAVGAGMKNAFPEIESSTKISPAKDFVQKDDHQFKEDRLAFADSNFLQFFGIPMVEGDPQTALSAPNSVVITRNFARKYFGNQDPLGQSLIIGLHQAVYKVTGLIEEIPDRSHFHFDAFISFSSWGTLNPTWSNIGYFTYVRLNPNADPKKLEAKFPQLVEEHVVPEVQHDMGVSLAEARKAVSSFVFRLVPLTRIHLYSHTKYELESNGDIQYVYIFSALAIFILLLACINFTNLSTARASKRAREVGIRKVVGSLRSQLILQFLAESMLFTLFALILAYLAVFLLLPYFNVLSDKHISFDFFLRLPFLLSVTAVSLAAGILAGLYPAFFLSSFNTIKVLKGSSLRGKDKKPLRSGLIVFQFFVSTALIMATLVVYRQMHFMQNKKLGYDKDQVLFLPDARLLGNRQLAFEQELLKDNRVLAASLSRSVPGESFMGGSQFHPRHEDGNGAEIHMNIFQVDTGYVRTLGLQVLNGRNFSASFPTDSQAVLLNESAVRQLGWTNETAVGKTIVRSGQIEYKVLGVLQDFNYASLKQEVAPLMLSLGYNSGGLIVKINTKDVSGFLDKLKQTWSRFEPQGPISFQFLDDNFNKLYRSEKRTQQIFSAFSVLAIVIASLGLFGLSAFVIQQRTREIGIRKVLGASVQNVLLLVSREFLILVGIAFLLAVPVTWWVMHQWLQDFAYRTSIGPAIFLLAGMVSLLIAGLTISFQALKSALANPVTSLRTE